MKYNIVLISIIYNEAKEILLIRRWRDPEQGKWSLPGGIGALETQSDPIVAVADEVRGEFGVEYINYNLLTIKYIKKTEPTICLYFYGMIRGIPQFNNKDATQEFKWFAIDNVIDTEIAFEDKDKEVIKLFKKQILSK